MLRPEYDVSTLKGACGAMYFDRATAGTTLVLLEALTSREAFPDGPSINQALRAYSSWRLNRNEASCLTSVCSRRRHERLSRNADAAAADT